MQENGNQGQRNMRNMLKRIELSEGKNGEHS